jgi:hypothetical protein
MKIQDLTYNHYYLSDFIRYNGGGSWGEYGQPIYLLDREFGYEFNGLLVSEKIDSILILSKNTIMLKNDDYF